MEDYDFSQIPLWDSNDPNFEIFSDSVRDVGRNELRRMGSLKIP